MKYIRGYRSLALLQMLMCVCFIINIDSHSVFSVVNNIGAGILLAGSIFAYHRARPCVLWTMVFTMLCLIAYNSVWYISAGVFLTTGFPLIAYDILFVIGSLHFLGKGLK